MTVFLFLLSSVALCLGIFGWLWLCGGALRSGWRGGVGKAAVQVSGLCLVFGFLLGAPLAGVFNALFPPLSLGWFLRFGGFPGLIWVLLRDVALWSVAVLILALAIRRLRVWAPGLAVAVALIGVGVSGDRVAEKAMCDAAGGRGFQTFTRLGLVESAALDRDMPVPPHAYGEAGGKRFGWSYGLMDWYEFPPGVGVVPEGASVTCPAG